MRADLFAPMDIPEIHFDALVARYRVILFDAYGVLVHAGGALPGAAVRLAQLRGAAQPFFVLTNDASKLPATAALRYQRYGLALDADQIISAGTLLTHSFIQQGLQGKRCAVLGPADSARYVELAGGTIASADEFDVLVLADESGYPLLDTVDRVLTTLYRKIDRGASVHLILPNPDLIYPRGVDSYGFASGAIATMIEGALQLGYPGRTDLRFTRLDKPATALFAAAARRSGTRDMVMIGDQLETDIRGARAFGIDAVLVTSGVAALQTLDAADQPRPNYWMSGLSS